MSEREKKPVPLKHMGYALVAVYHGQDANAYLDAVLYRNGDKWVAWTFNNETGGHCHGCYGNQKEALSGWCKKIGFLTPEDV